MLWQSTQMLQQPTRWLQKPTKHLQSINIGCTSTHGAYNTPYRDCDRTHCVCNCPHGDCSSSECLCNSPHGHCKHPCTGSDSPHDAYDSPHRGSIAHTASAKSHTASGTIEPPFKSTATAHKKPNPFFERLFTHSDLHRLLYWFWKPGELWSETGHADSTTWDFF